MSENELFYCGSLLQINVTNYMNKAAIAFGVIIMNIWDKGISLTLIPAACEHIARNMSDDLGVS